MTTEVSFTLDLDCGHSKMVTRGLDGAMPYEGLLVNCHGCTNSAGSTQLVMTRVAKIDLVGVGSR